jgi:hypothetical protein
MKGEKREETVGKGKYIGRKWRRKEIKVGKRRKRKISGECESDKEELKVFGRKEKKHGFRKEEK